MPHIHMSFYNALHAYVSIYASHAYVSHSFNHIISSFHVVIFTYMLSQQQNMIHLMYAYNMYSLSFISSEHESFHVCLYHVFIFIYMLSYTHNMHKLYFYISISCFPLTLLLSVILSYNRTHIMSMPCSHISEHDSFM